LNYKKRIRSNNKRATTRELRKKERKKEEKNISVRQTRESRVFSYIPESLQHQTKQKHNTRNSNSNSNSNNTTPR